MPKQIQQATTGTKKPQQNTSKPKFWSKIDEGKNWIVLTYPNKLQQASEGPNKLQQVSTGSKKPQQAPAEPIKNKNAQKLMEERNVACKK